MQYRQIQTIGGQFSASLRGICLDRAGRLFATGDSQLKVFDPAGKLLQGWGTAKPGCSVAVSGDGTVYSGQDGQVEIFAKGARRQWRPDGLLGEATAIGFFNGDILIADAKGRCIRRYASDQRFLNAIGKDNRTNGFLIPNGALDFSVDAAGIVHAANPGKHRVERYTCSGELLGHIGHFDGVNPAGFPGCCNPTNVAVGASGHVFVTEKAGPRAKVLDAQGNLVAVIAAGVFDPNCKNMAVAAGSSGRVYVADTVKLRIMVFEAV
jgi:hypothetical protein